MSYGLKKRRKRRQRRRKGKQKTAPQAKRRKVLRCILEEEEEEEESKEEAGPLVFDNSSEYSKEELDDPSNTAGSYPFQEKEPEVRNLS